MNAIPPKRRLTIKRNPYHHRWAASSPRTFTGFGNTPLEAVADWHRKYQGRDAWNREADEVSTPARA